MEPIPVSISCATTDELKLMVGKYSQYYNSLIHDELKKRDTTSKGVN